MIIDNMKHFLFSCAVFIYSVQYTQNIHAKGFYVVMCNVPGGVHCACRFYSTSNKTELS